jgi:HrpA-like RNA helicase
MKNKILGLIMVCALALSAVSLTSCGTTTNANGTTTSGYSAWMNDPANAAFISQVETFAFQQAINALNHLGANTATVEQNVVGKITNKYPNVPAAAAKKIAQDQTQKALAKKSAKK